MYINHFEGSIKTRLNQILNTLETVHGVSIKIDTASPTAEKSLLEYKNVYESKRNEIIAESSFNSYQQNPEYVKSILILEAVKIMLTEIGPKRRRTKKVAESVAINEKDSTLKDILSQAIESVSSYGTNWKRVNSALQNLRERVRSFIGNDHPAMSSIVKALSEFNSIPRTANGSDDFAKVLSELVSARNELETSPSESIEQLSERTVKSETQEILSSIGRAMSSYSEEYMAKLPKGTSVSDEELSKLNDISKTAEKLIQLGTPFSEKLDRMDIKTIASVLPQLELDPQMKEKISKSLSNVFAKNNLQESVKELGKWMKKSAKEFWHGTPEELEQERKDKEHYRKHVQNKNNNVDEASVSSGDMQKNFELGKAMIDYAEKAKPQSTEEFAMANAFSRVGDKLMHLGTPGGPKGLDDTDQKVARYAALKLKSLNTNNTMVSEAIGNSHSYEFQASMARSELYRNTKYAMSLMKQIDPHGEIKPWIASSLDKAKKYLDKIYHYLEYKSTFEPVEIQNEMDGDMELDVKNGEHVRHTLTEIAEYSIKIFEMIEPTDKLESWVAMKLTTASECISSCKHYMDYSQFEKHGLDNHFMEGRRMSRRKMAESLLIEQDQEELAKAQTILAAKDMSSKLQGMAEDVAKMAVEDLMPLVDVMRSQFGPEAADGFNQSAKSALESLLNATTDTKEQFDTALDTLSTGGVPTEPTDIGNASPDAGLDQTIPADSSDMSSDLADLANDTGGDEFGGDEIDDAPLGRSKKPQIGEAWGTKTKPSKDDGKWEGKSVAELRSLKSKLMNKKSRSKEEQKKVKELNFAIRAKTGWGKVNESAESKKCKECGKTFESTKMLKKCADHSKITETAPPGKKAEDFIKSNKKDFSKRYGKDGEKVLYATAWKNFGPKSESFNSAIAIIAEQKAIIKSLNEELKSHKKEWTKSLKEGKTVDMLNIGYGLEGNVIINKINRSNKKIDEAKKTIKEEMTIGIYDMIDAISAMSDVEKLSEMKNKTPYGVIYKNKDGQKCKKMFESVETREYWLGLKEKEVTNVQLIDPETFDRAMQSII